MTAAAFSTKDLALLGRTLIKKHPVMAEELLAALRATHLPPLETDLSKLSHLFDRFCELKDTSPEIILSARFNTEAMQLKRLFIGVAFSIYCPSAIAYPDMYLRKKMGIQKQLVRTLGVFKSNLNIFTHEVIFNYKVYDSFRQEVDMLTQILTHGKDHQQEDN